MRRITSTLAPAHISLIFPLALCFACGSGSSDDTLGGAGAATTGDQTATAAAGFSGTSASSGAAAGASAGGAGSSHGGSGGDGVGGGSGSGNSGGGTGGAAGSGGSANAGAAGVGGGSAGAPARPPLDCGPIGTALVDAGPPKNRVNYVILADGYDKTTVSTTLLQHANAAMAERFTAELGQPYLRYKNFVNICLYKTVSQTDGIGKGPTIFSCTGDDTSRLATCDTKAAQAALSANTPASLTVDWHAIVLNNDRWWNTGSTWMLWSGGNPDGAKAALHEGGHGFHQLADEYCATATGAACGPNGGGPNGTEYDEVDSTGDGTTSAGKWPAWLGVTQTGLAQPGAGATGVQGLFLGSRYVNTGQYRPSSNSKMNSLFGNDLDTSFNAVSREKMVLDIWRFVTPIDSTDPPAGTVTGAQALSVNVIDPAVINVDWSVDGTVKAANGGRTFSLAGLSSGSHTITAKAYDNATQDLVRQTTGAKWSRMNWARSVQTVTWMVSAP